MPYKQTDRVIAELVDATCGRQDDMRARYLLEQALYGLVRLAKVEQLTDMRLDSERADACDVTEPWITSFRGLASYRVPAVDMLVSATLRVLRPGAPGMPTVEAVSSLDRDLGFDFKDGDTNGNNEKLPYISPTNPQNETENLNNINNNFYYCVRR